MESEGGSWGDLGGAVWGGGGGGEGNSAQLQLMSCKNLPTDENVGV